MGEQIRAEDWLPQGWKVEIRVRKSGKKDRYYIDPTNGYIFRSLKDIDRYLLTGKLGRHVTKTKPKDLGNSIAKPDMKPVPLKQYESKKKVVRPTGMTKTCSAAPAKKSAGNSSQKTCTKRSSMEDLRSENSTETDKKKMKKDIVGTEDSTETVKKMSTASKRRNSKSSRKREVTPPFFIVDPDQCEDGGSAAESEIPNLSEIIDSIQKEREGHNTVYISAPAIGALLRGGQSPAARVEPQFSITLCNNYKPNFPSMFSTWNVTKQVPESNNTIQPNHIQDPSPHPDKSSEMVDSETKDKQEMGIPPVFGDLLTDPCIDFAIKTLTGTIPFGTEFSAEGSYFQHQVGSSTVLGDVRSCQN